jgi:hypothetical protein
MTRRLIDWRRRQADDRRRFDQFGRWRVEERDRRRGLLADDDGFVMVVNVLGPPACPGWLIVIEA